MNKESRVESALLEPTIHIGKSGIGTVVEELKKQLKGRKMVKVRLLKTALLEGNKQELAEKLSFLTDCELVEVRGNTAVFRRKG